MKARLCLGLVILVLLCPALSCAQDAQQSAEHDYEANANLNQPFVLASSEPFSYFIRWKDNAIVEYDEEYGTYAVYNGWVPSFRILIYQYDLVFYGDYTDKNGNIRSGIIMTDLRDETRLLYEANDETILKLRDRNEWLYFIYYRNLYRMSIPSGIAERLIDLPVISYVFYGDEILFATGTGLYRWSEAAGEPALLIEKDVEYIQLVDDFIYYATLSTGEVFRYSLTENREESIGIQDVRSFIVDHNRNTMHVITKEGGSYYRYSMREAEASGTILNDAYGINLIDGGLYVQTSNGDVYAMLDGAPALLLSDEMELTD